eukprot:scaffold125461_cov66-Phaeocystis_antarctica.AAC.6
MPRGHRAPAFALLSARAQLAPRGVHLLDEVQCQLATPLEAPARGGGEDALLERQAQLEDERLPPPPRTEAQHVSREIHLGVVHIGHCHGAVLLRGEAHQDVHRTVGLRPLHGGHDRGHGVVPDPRARAAEQHRDGF